MSEHAIERKRLPIRGEILVGWSAMGEVAGVQGASVCRWAHKGWLAGVVFCDETPGRPVYWCFAKPFKAAVEAGKRKALRWNHGRQGGHRVFSPVTRETAGA